MSEIALENVCYRYPKSKEFVLLDINAVFKAGEVSSVTGPSGAGKSTLLYLISGLDVPTSGHILLDGTVLIAHDLDNYRKLTVSTISQSNLFFSTLTVLENVMYPLLLSGTDKRDSVEIAAEKLTFVGIGNEMFKRLPSKLSGGEQQRVAIARCLAADSQIIVADEPTANLDEKNAWAVLNMMADLAHNKGKTVIFGTHDRLISDNSDRLFKMENGRMY